MCGRYSLVLVGKDLLERFLVEGPTPTVPRYNISPGQRLPIITMAEPKRMTEAIWGYRPAWAKSSGVINARAESITSKPYFRDALRKRRCLIPADGFFEWTTTKGKRLPYRFTVRQQPVFAFAGVYDDRGTDDQPPGYAIITTVANNLVGRVHDRMPVLLKNCFEHRWLDPTLPVIDAEHHLKPYPEAEMAMIPVAPKINRASYDAPDAIEPIA